MDLETFLFYAFALLAVATSILVVTLKSIARALFLFFVVLFAMAGLYLFALADFVAITQIMIYVGGVLILMLFAFMLSNKTILDDLQHTTGSFVALPKWQVIPVVLGFFALLIYGILQWQQQVPVWIQQAETNGTVISAADNNIHQLGIRFMTFYVLPFEIVSIFLMAALIGASHLSRKDQDR